MRLYLFNVWDFGSWDIAVKPVKKYSRKRKLFLNNPEQKRKVDNFIAMDYFSVREGLNI